MKVYLINIWEFNRLRYFTKCILIVIKSIAKISYITSYVLFSTGATVKFMNSKIWIAFITPCRISYLFPSAPSNLHVSSVYRQTWQRLPLHRALMHWYITYIHIYIYIYIYSFFSLSFSYVYPYHNNKKIMLLCLSITKRQVKGKIRKNVIVIYLCIHKKWPQWETA